VAGGYWCWDETSCQERYQTLKFDMSSSGWGKLFAQDGIFSTVQANNPFANANMVFVKYCSSDSWFGDAPASSATWGFSFRGSRSAFPRYWPARERCGGRGVRRRSARALRRAPILRLLRARA